MLIDKTHSKKDIITLFKKLNVIIDDELTKGEITSNIEEYINNAEYNDTIKNCTELKEHLKNRSKKQKPTSRKKQEIMFNAKKIINWAKNNYVFNSSTYKTIDEPFMDIMSIYIWGDLPTVRRACRLYNSSIYCKDNVNPVITKDVEEEIHKNKLLKKNKISNLKIIKASKDNPIIISF